MKVHFYGRLADAIGRDVELDVPAGSSVAAVRDRLSETYPRAADSLAKSRAVVGHSAVGEDRRLAAEESIEFLPPVSGG